MILALGLLVAGLAVVLWRPCRWAQGWAPRSAVALLLAAAAAVWIGSLGVAVGLASGELGGTLAACGVLWRRLLGGQLGWWQTAALALWAVALPARGVWSLAVGGVRSRRLLRKLAAAGMAPLQPAPAASGTFVVSGLSTTAVTLGVLRPLILVDGRFWRTATPLQRQVVVAHEEGHRRGRHVLVDGAARALTAGLAPLPAAGRAYQWVRRQLEALADDAAVRRHDRHTVGLELGRIALADHPRAGLGASGAALWRVQRLLAPPSPPPRRAALLLPAASVLAVGAAIVLADTARALGPVATARLCPV